MQFKSKSNVVDLAAFAFRGGAHGTSIEDLYREIDSAHDKERAKAEEESVRRHKPFEAQVESLEHRRGIVDAAWNDVLRRLGHHEPPVATAFLVCLLGMAALAVDAVLLGPGLDALGISDLGVQLAAAFGLAALSSVAFHFTHESFERNQLNIETRIGWRILGGVTAFALLAWGVLRGYQVQFTAHLNDNPLGDFLGAHTVLASIFFCFITLASPLVGAAAIHYAVPRVSDWRHWRKAQREHEALHQELTESRKKLELEREALVHQLAQLNAQQENWHAFATQYHERGRRHGALKVPLWLVVLKASLWGLGGLVAGCVLGTYLAPLYFALPVGAWTAAFLFCYNRRSHPSYDQFKRQENTRFTVIPDAPQPRELRTPPPRQLSKGNQS
jgi:hypothetical protein